MRASGPGRGVKLATFAALLLIATSSATAGTGNANFFLGWKSLEENDWEPLEDQAEFGAEISFGKDDWPVSIAIDLFGSATEETFLGTDLEGSTSELGVGVRKIWEADVTRPYIGGGIGFFNAELDASMGGISVNDDDNGVGVWVGGGVFWRLGSRLNLGIAARLSKAEVTLFGVDAEAGGLHLGVLLGWGWPASN